MRTDNIRTLEDLDKAIAGIDRKLDRTEYQIQRDFNNLLDFYNLILAGFNAVMSFFGKKEK